MDLIATKLHGYRKEGERFSCEEPLASILINKGSAKQINNNDNEKINSVSGAGTVQRGRKRTAKSPIE